MKYYKNLNIKGAILDKYALGKYIEKVAENHNVVTKSDKKTYPIPGMKDNFNFIYQTYKLLNEHLKLGISIHSAGEWILDNFYLIEETVKNLEKEINIKDYKKLNGIGDGKYDGYARVYVLASEIVGYTDSKIDSEFIKYAVDSYQKKKLLTTEELMMLPCFIKISLIESISECCEKIYVSQIQKYKVEDICARIIDQKEELQFKKNRFKVNVKNKFDYSDLKDSFIEYMSYKLKRKGKLGNPYLEVLNEQVEFTGTTVSEVIKKEHFHIATIKNSLGNNITSIKNINRINFKELFENLNKVEEILSKDPSGIFDKMTQDTKDMYLKVITDISKKINISEIYIASKVILLCNRYKDVDKNDLRIFRKSHVGYYLIDKGREELLFSLNGKKVKNVSDVLKEVIFVRSCFYIPVIISLFLIYILNLSFILSIVCFLLLLFPVSEIYIKFLMYITSKIVKSKKIPKININNNIKEENSCFVVIPTIINSLEKIDELVKKIEVYYLANKSKNIYFAILGDCTSSKKEIESLDKEIIRYGREKVKKLNEKYDSNIFHFLYRKRRWNSKEQEFLGWERKRGILNQFNKFLLEKDNSDFIINTLEENNFNKKIKYIITLDSDTNLVLNSAFSMIGAMTHILNRPIIENKKVIDGYGIMEPRVGIGLKDSIRSIFTRIYSGSPGTNIYESNASDFYQDCFREAIFTGKGIYDLDVYSSVLEGEIKENEVLSHDLLEGNYLRCGLLNDVVILDKYPYKFTSYVSREHRWIRGDWQLLKWIKRDKRNINLISKFKIYDNLRRSILPITELLLFFIAILENNFLLMIIDLFAIFLPIVYSLLDKIIFKKSNNNEIINAYKNFSVDFTGLKGEFIKQSLNFIFLPTFAYVSLNAIIKTIYRLIKQIKLLEWVTSEEAEKRNDTSIETYYKIMFPNLILGIILFGFLNPFVEIVATLWVFAPFVAWYISIDDTKKQDKYELENESRKYLYEIGNKTWNFFRDYLNKQNNYLIPDNFQLGRKQNIVYRTSSTNIGLSILSIISAYDLNYIDIDKCINLLNKVIEKIEILDKWNGHLYNWYNIKTLKPLYPRYVSTVDSGNFIGYLYVLKSFLIEIIDEKVKIKKDEKENQINKKEINEENKKEKSSQISNILEESRKLYFVVCKLINDTDFSVLYSKKDKLLSIGYDVENMKLTDSYYDFLASEARQASFIAIAKKDIDEKHWSNLSRTLTTIKKYKGLISWSGTTFEYLMPNINMNSYEGSLLNESCKFMIMSQMEYAEKLKVPWGISESAYNVKDLNGNYQYKAFGIPWLGLKRGLEEELVISPYSTFLALNFYPKEAIENLKLLENIGAYSEYGFFESIDFTKSRLKKGEDFKIVKTYMAHHQGLILNSINNVLNNKILNKRFFMNPEIESTDILLQEKMPNSILISKNINNKLKKQKYVNEFYDKEVVYKNKYISEKKYNRINVISSDEYTLIMDMFGRGFSKYKDIQINRFYKKSDYFNQNGFYIKNLKTNKIWATMNNINDDLNRKLEYETTFSSSKIEYTMLNDGIETEYKLILAANNPSEIRRLIIRNSNYLEENLEITGVIEGIFSNVKQDIAHPVFNNMFLNFEYIKEKDIFIIQRNDRDEKNSKYYYGIKMFINKDNSSGKTNYEIDKEKFLGRKNINVPDLIMNSNNYENKIKDTVDPILAINKKIKIKFNEEVIIDFIISINEDKESLIKQLDNYNNEEKRNSEFKLFKSRVEEELKYLQLNGDKIHVYQKLLGHIIFEDIPKRNDVLSRIYNNKYIINDLWKFGISGDNKILTVHIKNIDDIEVIKEILKALEFYIVKNINIDLCILNGEENSYELVLKDLIYQAIREAQMEYLLNKKIFVINEFELEKSDIDLLYFKSSLYLDIKYGSLNLNINDIENKAYYDNKNDLKIKKDYLDLYNQYNKNNLNIQNEKSFSKVEILNETDKSYSDIINDSLLFFNGIGGFSKNNKEYIFKSSILNEVPRPWINILCNRKFGCIVTDNFGGFIWSENSRLNRITKWDNDPIIDIPSEIFYIKDLNSNKYWSMFSRVANEMDYIVKHGQGYSNFMQVCDDLLQNLNIYVDNDEEKRNVVISIKNLSADNRKLKLYYYINTVLGEDIDKTDDNIICFINKKDRIISFKNIFKSQFEKTVNIMSSENINKVYLDKSEFFGKENNITAPKVILNDMEEYEDDLEYNIHNDSFDNYFFKTNSIVLEYEINMQSYENKDIVLSIGTEEIKEFNLNKDKEINSLEDIRNNWSKKLSVLQINTPSIELNTFINSWCIYQILTSRIYSKTAYYQSGGAIGYRDQLQDTLGLKYIDSDYMKEYIINAASHQFIEGDVLHWWHEKTNLGVRTKFSDDFLWLVYATIEYLEYTEDYDILNMMIPYLQGENLKDDETEKCKEYNLYGKEETLFDHCIKAIERGINLGENNLPKIGSGDWNDGFSNIGEKGKGESIWLGFFLFDILNRFEKILKKLNKNEIAKRYRVIKDILRKSLNDFAWDGKWYIRAVTDTGEIIGSKNNKECMIDSISQSFSVISEAGEQKKALTAMDNVEKYLIDRENKIIKLLDPPFENKEYDPGYISKYKPGVRENGGQYTHGVIWSCLAFLKLGLNDKAFEYINMLNPIMHTNNIELVNVYKAEPYVLAGDVYTNKDMYGKAGWTWYTGAASWYYKVIVENILGIKIKGNKLYIEPKIPNSWDGFSLRYQYKNSIYRINIKNVENNAKKKTIRINGLISEKDYIELLDNNRDFTIDIEM